MRFRTFRDKCFVIEFSYCVDSKFENVGDVITKHFKVKNYTQVQLLISLMQKKYDLMDYHVYIFSSNCFSNLKAPEYFDF